MKAKSMIIAALIIWTVFHLPQNSISQTISQADNPDDFIAPSIGQTFTATMDGHITHIEVKAASKMKTTLRIFTYDGRELSENPIAVQKVKFDGRNNSKIPLEIPLEVKKGEKYLFVFTNDDNTVVRFEGKRQDTYDGGNMHAYLDNPYVEYDLYFKVWETDKIRLLGSK